MEHSTVGKTTLMAMILLLVSTPTCFAAPPLPNTWTGSGPFATGAGDRVATALAVSPDGQTVYSGTASGTLFSYDYGYLLTVATGGSGIGQVTSDSGGISCVSGSGTACAATYLHDTVVSLTASTMTGKSTFDGWSQDCSGVAPCLVAMTADRNVGAVFGLGAGEMGPKARIQSSGTGYASVYSAYQAAGADQVVLAVSGSHSGLLMDEGKTVTLKGGYALDAEFNFTVQSGYSNIAPPLKVTFGRLNADRIRITPQ